MNFVEALSIAIIEGLTELFPVSSTAHMIFMSTFFGIQKNEFVKMYQISIQFGAILAVIVFYWKNFFNSKEFSFYLKLFLAVIPSLILGKLFDDKIEKILENPFSIAIILIIGGIILLFIDTILKYPQVLKKEDITTKQAIVIGFWQCLAIVPGTSRSAASIIGAMQQGLSRNLAIEFSFLLAVPTMIAVSCYSIFFKDWDYQGKEQKGFEMIFSSQENTINFIGGNIIAFLVTFIAIKLFIGILKRFGFKIWGVYRIVVGVLILIYLYY